MYSLVDDHVAFLWRLVWFQIVNDAVFLLPLLMFPADWLMFKKLQKTCVCKMSSSAYNFLYVRCVTLLTLAKLSLSMYMLHVLAGRHSKIMFRFRENINLP